MATDPAKFVVRHPAFNQTPDYPHFAADLVDFMLTAEIPNAEVLYRVIGGAIEEQNKKQPFTYNKGRTLFGKIREDDPEEQNGRLSITTLGSGRFNEGFKEALLRKEGTRDVRHPFTWQFQHEDAALGILANLSLVSNQFPEEILIMGGAPGVSWPPHTPVIRHPVAAGEEWEAIKAVMEASFSRATSGSKNAEERKDAALEAASLLTHAMPTYRGGSIVMMVGLEYLAARAGFETDFFHEGQELYTKAVLQNPAEFWEAYKSGKYKDPGATSKDIMAWYQNAIDTGFELNLS